MEFTTPARLVQPGPCPECGRPRLWDPAGGDPIRPDCDRWCTVPDGLPPA